MTRTTEQTLARTGADTRRGSSARRPALLLAAAAIAATTVFGAGCTKSGDGASGVNPPSGTRSPDSPPPTTPRQP